MKKLLIQLDDLANICGYFSDIEGYSYGCKNKKCEDEDEEGRGKCFSWSCPIAYPASKKELLKNNELNDSSFDGDTWMIKI